MKEKYPGKIPWSSIDNIDLDSIVSDAVEEQFRKERQEEYNKRPYQDLSERKEKLKDHTKVFKGIYEKVEKDLKSDDPKAKGVAQLKLHNMLAVYSGRPLTAHELKNIIIHCEIKKPRMSINAFGQLYSTKEINSSFDMDWK
jgi:hypothetical protein